MLAAAAALAFLTATPAVHIDAPAAVVDQDMLRIRAAVTCEHGLRAKTFLSFTADTTVGAVFTQVRTACTGRPREVSRSVPLDSPFNLNQPTVRRVWVCARSLVNRVGAREPVAAAQQCAPVQLRPGSAAINPIDDALVEASAAGRRRLMVRPAFACTTGVTIFATLTATQAHGATGTRGVFLRCRETSVVRPRIPVRVRGSGPELDAGAPTVLCVTARVVERRGRRGFQVGAGAECGSRPLDG